MSKNVLVVDDSVSLRQVIVMSLKNLGLHVEQAGNGKEALEKINSFRPDLIISDVNMPVMDGLTFIKSVKENSDLKFIPILMLTTETDEKLKEEGKSLGIRAWLTKPFDPRVLLASVEKLVQ